MRKKLTAIILILGLSLTGFAETFVVTSNADSGPGTLREAITKANVNGTTEKDFILFQIPDQSITARTIVLIDTLPALTSHISIDATSQSGGSFGVMDAKIKIVSSGANVPRCFVLMNVEDIEIYSLFMISFKTSRNMLFDECAIYITGQVSNIKIGKPGGGNSFDDNSKCIYKGNEWTYWQKDLRLSDIEIKSNFFGLSENGNLVTSHQCAILLNSARNITIGGTTENEGNYFVSDVDQTIILRSDSSQNNGFIKFLNNKCGVSYDLKTPLKFGGLSINNQSQNRGDEFVTLHNNIFNNPSYVGSNNCHRMIGINGIRGFISIKGNKIGNLLDFFTCQYVGIGITNCEDGILGGDSESEKNTIAANYSYGVSLGNNNKFTIKKNSFYCNSDGIHATSNKVTVPEIKIMQENGSDFVSGTADPNCRIEVFETPSCSGCNNGKVFLGETVSDGSGKWSFAGNYSSAVTATATSSIGVTGDFAKPKFDANKLQTQLPTCLSNNGSIKGMKFISGTKYYWIRNTMEAVDTFFNQLDLIDVGPGIYEFVAEQTKYCSVKYQTSLYDNSPKINKNNVRLTQPSCGKSSGRIDNIYAKGSYNKLFWKDENNNIYPKTLQDYALSNLYPGRYKFIVLDTVHGCGDSTEYFILHNLTGPSFILANVQLTPASCNASTGSIKNISVSNQTGSASTYWIDSLNRIVGYSFDLLNVPSGRYRLKFKDQSSCDTITTPYYNIQGLGGITIDTTGKQITPSSCIGATGSIQSIKSTGGDNYAWINTNNQTVGTTKDIGSLAPGDYQLKITNSLGCEKTSPVVTVPQFGFNSLTITSAATKDATCDEQNGLINITGFSKNTSGYTFQWRDERNQIIGTNTGIFNLGIGTYLLYAKDINGCEQEIYKKQIKAFTKPSFEYSAVQLQNDQCAQQTGSISHLSIKGLQGPTQYTWYDKNNTFLSATADLRNKGVGIYKLQINDNGCIIESKEFTLINLQQTLSNPAYKDLMIAKYSEASLTPSNRQDGSYQLFKDAAGLQLIQQNSTGQFTVGPISTDTAFFVQRVWGSCKSDLTRVTIKAVDETRIYVPTAFTPNNDGRNDVLRPSVQGILTLYYFIIYDRWGNAVFESSNLNKGWNGTFNSLQSPVGAYVWIIKGQDFKGNIIQQKGSFILIR